MLYTCLAIHHLLWGFFHTCLSDFSKPLFLPIFFSKISACLVLEFLNLLTCDMQSCCSHLKLLNVLRLNNTYINWYVQCRWLSVNERLCKCSARQVWCFGTSQRSAHKTSGESTWECCGIHRWVVSDITLLCRYMLRKSSSWNRSQWDQNFLLGSSLHQRQGRCQNISAMTHLGVLFQSHNDTSNGLLIASSCLYCWLLSHQWITSNSVDMNYLTILVQTLNVMTRVVLTWCLLRHVTSTSHQAVFCVFTFAGKSVTWTMSRQLFVRRYHG